MNLIESIEKYRRATEEFISTVSGLTPTELDTAKNQGWTARQVIHHVADSEVQSYSRLRRLIAEPNTQIQGYDEAAWEYTINNWLETYIKHPSEHAVQICSGL